MVAELKYEDISFEELEETVRVSFLKNYFFEVDKRELSDIADFRVEKDRIIFETNEKRATNKFGLILAKGMANLKNKLGGRHTVYISRESGIPLLGNNAFGLIDRNTSLIEVKPMTGCNLSCIFCSVGEGNSGEWGTDFVVEPGYLVEEFERLALRKGGELEAHIGTHGEPLLYPKLIELVAGLSRVKGVKRISMDTNGTLLTKKLVDELAKAGMTCINLSVNALDPKIASRMAGCPYNIEHVLKMAEYTKDKLGLLIAPVWVPGINDGEMPKIIELGKRWGVRVAIQNFLSYKHGRNPVKGMSWEEFYKRLAELEKEHGLKLIYSEKDFHIEKTPSLEKPFRKEQVVEAEVVCEGRLKGEKIAVAKERNISVPDCSKRGRIRVKITRDKHNIFFGRCL